MSVQSTPADDKSSRLKDVQRIRKALSEFGSGYECSLILLNRRALAERIKESRHRIMVQVEDLQSDLIDYIRNYMESVYILAKFSSDGRGIFSVKKYSSLSIKLLSDQPQRNTFYMTVNEYNNIVDQLLSDVLNGKYDHKLQSNVELLLYERIKDFGETKYSWKNVRVLGEDMSKPTHKKGRRRRLHPIARMARMAITGKE